MTVPAEATQPPKPINWHVTRMRRAMRSLKDRTAALATMEILGIVRNGDLAPFVYNEAEIAEKLAKVYKENSITEAHLLSMRGELLEHFFEELPDGRWEPNRKLFSERPDKMVRRRYD